MSAKEEIEIKSGLTVQITMLDQESEGAGRDLYSDYDGLYTDNDGSKRRFPGEVLKTLLRDREEIYGYTIRYLWGYFMPYTSSDENVLEKLLTGIEDGRITDKKPRGKRTTWCEEEQVFEKLADRLRIELNRYNLKKGRWTSQQLRKMLLGLKEETFIKIFAPVLGMTRGEINNFLLKAYWRQGLNPFEYTEFFLYVSIPEYENHAVPFARQSYYPIYIELCRLYEELDGIKNVSDEPNQATAQILFDKADEVIGKIWRTKEKMLTEEGLNEHLRDLVRTYKQYVDPNKCRLSKEELKYLFWKVKQLYAEDIISIFRKDRDEDDDVKWKKQGGVKVKKLDESQEKNSHMGWWMEAPCRDKNGMRIAKNTEVKVNKVENTEGNEYIITAECDYGSYIPKGAIFYYFSQSPIIPKTGEIPRIKKAAYEVTKAYLAVADVDFYEYFYKSLPYEVWQERQLSGNCKSDKNGKHQKRKLINPYISLDDETDVYKIEYRKYKERIEAYSIGEWFTKTKIDYNVFNNWTDKNSNLMTKRNYVLTLLFLKFVKEKPREWDEWDKDKRRIEFQKEINSKLREWGFPELYMRLPYDVLLLYLLGNREPEVQFRELWTIYNVVHEQEDITKKEITRMK